MQQSTLTVVPNPSPATKASLLDERIALFQHEHAKLMALDNEVQTLREQRRTLQAHIPQAKVRREELRQARINQLMGGTVCLEAAREYRELGELLEDAEEAVTMSEKQERRLAMPLYDAHMATSSALSMVAGCYESYLDYRVAPAILKPLKQQVAELASLAHAKACILGQEGALRWAQAELNRALKEAMNGPRVALAEDKPAAREVLATPTRPRAFDLLRLCDSPGKRQLLKQEMNQP